MSKPAPIYLSEDEIISIAFDNPQTLSEEDVLAMVEEFDSGVTYRGPSAPSLQTSIVNKRFLVLKADVLAGIPKDDSILVYTVCMAGEKSGFAIVSADERSVGVLAYVEDGNPDSIENTGAEMMVSLSEMAVMADVLRVERQRATKRDETLLKISEMLGKDSISYDDIKYRIQKVDASTARSENIYYPLGHVRLLMGPITKTRWSQGEPYNSYLPKSYNPKNGVLTHYPAGSAIVAGAQTLAAVAPNITVNGVDIDWGYLVAQPQIPCNSYESGDEERINMVATVVRDMYERTESTPNVKTDYEYGEDGDLRIPCVLSSTTSVSKLISYLNKYVSCGPYYDSCNPDALIRSLNANQKMPCVAIMGADRAGVENHSWVVDGYAVCTKFTRGAYRSNDLYFHTNIGLGGVYDGYYRVNEKITTDFETIQGTYNINFWEITEIHRK